MPGSSLGLCVETSSVRGSIALMELGGAPKPLAEESWQKSGSHSERITLAAQALLDRTGKKLSDIDQFAVGLGPGSFTGIRVGVNLVRTWAYVLAKPAFGVSSLRLMAQPELSQNRKVLTIINAFKNKFYSAGYVHRLGHTEIWLEPSALSPAELMPYLSQGESIIIDSQSTLDVLTATLDQSRNVLNLARLALPLATELWSVITLDQVTANTWSSIKPLYVRASEAEEKLRDGTLKLPPRL